MVATAGDAQALQQALRDELRDPSVALYFSVEDQWRSADGTLTAAPGGPDRDIVGMLVEEGRPRVLASLDGGDRLDPVRRRVALASAEMVLHAAFVAIERDAYVAELAASRTRITAEAESQRRRLERMLHDGVQQSLLAATATLSRAKLAWRSSNSDAVAASIEEAHRQLLDALGELRNVARGIYPAALAETGLVGGVENLAARWPTVTLTVEPPEDAYAALPLDRASLLYFAIAEGLNNAHKYGTPPVTIRLRQDADTVTGEIADAGQGGARLVSGGGIEGLGDRASGLGGSVRLTSPDGGPTTLTVVLPRH
jgi:signal transduction histidine kinase